MIGVGLYIEESVQEILGRFHAAVTRELGFHESSLKLAAPILLQDIARGLRRDTATREPWRRAVLLILSQPEGGIRGLVREFGELRRALWETLASRGHAVPGEERRAVDRLIDEALAAAAERWAGLVRLLPAGEARSARAAAAARAQRPAAPRPPRLPVAPRPNPRTPPPLPISRGGSGPGDGRH